jgi:hypothetical protein
VWDLVVSSVNTSHCNGVCECPRGDLNPHAH